MIRRFFWHLVFAIFILAGLTNIFQKLRWSSPTDRIHWEPSSNGLVCGKAPAQSPVQPGDILLSVNNYLIGDAIDLARVLEGKKYARYEVEREGIIRNVGIDVAQEFTPFPYFIQVFAGLLFLMLTLGVLNINLKQRIFVSPPILFYLLTLSFAGFLIFSPTGEYHLTDFIFLVLDRISFLLFPPLLLHYSFQFPIPLLAQAGRKRRALIALLYLSPISLLGLEATHTLRAALTPGQAGLTAVIARFRTLELQHFALFALLALVSFTATGVRIVWKKRQKKYILPYAGLVLSTISVLALTIIPPLRGNPAGLGSTLGLIPLCFMPLGLVYLLAHRRFTDIENIIRTTLSISSVFVFIFGVYLFLGLNIEQNKLIGIFWSVAAILTAGLLFKPLETTIQRHFERIFYRETFHFKRKLKELEKSISTQRDLRSLAEDFLGIIRRGFQLQQCALWIREGEGVFVEQPTGILRPLSPSLIAELGRGDHLVFLSSQEMAAKFPADATIASEERFFQFLPLQIAGRLIGAVAIGRKQDHTYLSVEDWELISSIAAPLALAVENAFLYHRLETQLHEINLLKEFNENVIENINLGIVVIARDGRIGSWNSFMERRFALDRKRVLGRPFAEVLGAELAAAVEGKDAAPLDQLRNRRIPVGEDEFVADIYLSELRGASDGYSGRIVVFEDITEKTVIQKQLITSEKMASVGLLSASIAHEINTPLTGISSYCQFLLENPADPECPDWLAKIQTQVERANGIVRTLLDFSRQKEDRPVSVSLAKVVEDSISLARHKLKKKNVALSTRFDEVRPMAGFPSRLQQLFINLIINAADAVDDNGAISIQLGENDRGATIRVKDNGRGIPERELDRIFDPFFTTKDVGKGTGLGLAIVYNVVKEHGGQITVHSKVGKGTTFLIDLPFDSPLRSLMT